MPHVVSAEKTCRQHADMLQSRSHLVEPIEREEDGVLRRPATWSAKGEPPTRTDMFQSTVDGTYQ